MWLCHLARSYFTVIIMCLTSGRAQTNSLTYMNFTGGSFPLSLYQQSTFFYQFQSPSDNLLYDGPDSAAGKCNIMGYWSAKNSKQVLNGQYLSLPSSFTGATITTSSGATVSAQIIEDNECNDACTPSNGCGFDSCATPKPDKDNREPLGKTLDYAYAQKCIGSSYYDYTYCRITLKPILTVIVINTVDIAASDGLMNLWPGSCIPVGSSTSQTLPSDLDNFPDLQMFPAVAGAVVPIYNIPEIPSNSNLSLVLNRKTLKNIFIGNIQVSIF
jgi:hypothetical protein